jgi:predicted Fe-Mo cluster-binding NifX family protein
MSWSRQTKAAFPYWENRIAPVFDTASQIYVVEARSGQIVSETQEIVPDSLPVQKTLRLVGLGIGTVVCGAISRPMHALVAAYGIQLIPFIAGDLHDVVQAWLQGNLTRTTFVMPGCYGRGARGLSGTYERIQDGDTMKRTTRGNGAGGGKGQGHGGGRSGGAGSSAAVVSIGYCICPQCGYREAHKRGVPCVERQCPKCGTVMTRE